MQIIMNKFFLLILATFTGITSFSQEIKKDLKPFTKIIASPHINVILKKGPHENIRLVYDNSINESKINIAVKNKTLQIYLDHARKVEKSERRKDESRSRNGIYKGVSITAYVTYNELESLEIRGNQELTCHDPISSAHFTLKAYGENDINLASLKTEIFRATLYGENDLSIKNGKVIEQRYRLYGENKIDTRDMKSIYASTSIFGEGDVRINSSEEVRINAFGEPQIHVDGGAHVSKRLIFGKAEIYHQ